MSHEPPKKRQKSASAGEDVEMNEASKASPGPSKSSDAPGHAASSEPPAVAEDSGYVSALQAAGAECESQRTPSYPRL